VAILLLNSRANWVEPEQPVKMEKKKVLDKISLWTLADCEWRAAVPGLKPLHLPRARLPGLDITGLAALPLTFPGGLAYHGKSNHLVGGNVMSLLTGGEQAKCCSWG